MRKSLAIIGGGPAGMAAGLYAARMNVPTVLLEKGPLGGQLLNTDLIEDYPGIRSIQGAQLASQMGKHARAFGLEIKEFDSILSVTIDGIWKTVHLESGDELKVPALILATGGIPRKLDVPGELELAGRGVSYCAVCDGAFFKNVPLAVIGGGDAAVEEADFLTRYASEVFIIHRRESFRAQSLLIDRARSNPKIHFIMDAVVRKIIGNGRVNSISYRQGNQEKNLMIGGVFIFVGFLPNSSILPSHAGHDSSGYLRTDSSMRTSLEGVWAVGDVRSQLTRQISTAVGDGTTAAVDVSGWLRTLGPKRSAWK